MKSRVEYQTEAAEEVLTYPCLRVEGGGSVYMFTSFKVGVCVHATGNDKLGYVTKNTVANWSGLKPFKGSLILTGE